MDMHRDGTIPCKLTAEQVLDIRSRVGQSCQELANEFGVYKSTISKILLRKTWAHI
jgi:transposase